MTEISEYIDKRYTFRNKGLSERYRIAFDTFKRITDDHGCDKYEFILLLTQLEERFGWEMYETAQEILDNFVYKIEKAKEDPECEMYSEITKNIAFASFYYLALVQDRFGDKEGLKSVLSTYYTFFKDEYLLNDELFARYCICNNDCKKALEFVRSAEKKLKKLGLKNVALGISYANSVVSIAEYCFLHKCIYKEGKVKKKNIENDTNDDDPKTIDEIAALEFVGPYNYDDSDLKEEIIENAFEKIEDAIRFNDKYPKYPFLKAKLLFYYSFYDDNKLSECEKKKVEKLMEKATKLLDQNSKNYDFLSEQYDSFLSIVRECPINSKEWHVNANFKTAAAKNNIIRSVDSKKAQPSIYKEETKAPHVFVSYSSLDYKSVYCDMIEYAQEGIRCDYDNDMTAYDNSTDAEKQKWYAVVEEKIRNSSCVLCYLSEQYVISKATLLELKLIEKYKKPLIAIDLSGKHKISDLLVNMSKKSEFENIITSERLYWFCKMFDDDNNVISRRRDYLFGGHIKKVKKRLSSICSEVINGFIATSGILENRGKGHPLEDSYACYNNQNIYVVSDGITRQNADEYKIIENNCIAQNVSKKFCSAFYEAIVGELFGMVRGERIHDKLITAFNYANGEVKKISDEYISNYPEIASSPNFELPGAVGITAVIYNDTLYFGSVGDCVGILVRNGRKMIFSDKQTTYAFDKAGVERNRELLKQKYVNKPDNPYGYGVINGEVDAVKFFNVGHLALEYGDTIYLVSDGIADYIRYCNPSVYERLTVDEIILEAVKLEETIHGTNCSHDDMSIIRIRWEANMDFKEKN